MLGKETIDTITNYAHIMLDKLPLDQNASAVEIPIKTLIQQSIDKTRLQNCLKQYITNHFVCKHKGPNFGVRRECAGRMTAGP